jgi:hypothetical protein
MNLPSRLRPYMAARAMSFSTAQQDGFEYPATARLRWPTESDNRMVSAVFMNVSLIFRR